MSTSQCEQLPVVAVQGDGCQQQSFHVAYSVRNTFIDGVVEERQEIKRRSSCPCLVKHSCAVDVEEQAMPSGSATDAQPDQEEDGEMSTHASSESVISWADEEVVQVAVCNQEEDGEMSDRASSESWAEAVSRSPASSDAGCQQADRAFSTCSGCSARWADEEVEQVVVCNHEEDGELPTRASSESLEEAVFRSLSSSDAGCQQADQAVSDAGCQQASSAEVVGRTVLRATGRTWRPSGSVFVQEAFALAEEVSGVLRDTFGIQASPQVGSYSAQHSVCSLFASVSSDDAQTLGASIEEVARNEVFARCSRTRGVCLLGFKQQPFTRMPQGFTATLANVPSSKKLECKTMYRNGHCRGCAREHPHSFVSFQFFLVVDDATAAGGEHK